MGHYSDYYEQEKERSDASNKERALKEFTKKVQSVTEMDYPDIEAINTFIHWYKELQTGLRAVRSIYKKII